ncbi:hypothetical protein QBC35DRAFT_149062 [Podospora australis]|uniref:Uncharacterized protein n=1 Tax=Podospora australis TaxID=1536484 RepID=A0AAN6X0G3_9PEZI|nr:hypothetical protein QBC35DRAFT_149062 [Podospora australis]
MLAYMTSKRRACSTMTSCPSNGAAETNEGGASCTQVTFEPIRTANSPRRNSEKSSPYWDAAASMCKDGARGISPTISHHTPVTPRTRSMDPGGGANSSLQRSDKGGKWQDPERNTVLNLHSSCHRAYREAHAPSRSVVGLSPFSSTLLLHALTPVSCLFFPAHCLRAVNHSLGKCFGFVQFNTLQPNYHSLPPNLDRGFTSLVGLAPSA